jgi:hypothetical protein
MVYDPRADPGASVALEDSLGACLGRHPINRP